MNTKKRLTIGLTENSFKTHYATHRASFNHCSKRNNTELSSYIWQLKDAGVSYRRVRAYNNSNNRCGLCLAEKYYMICQPNTTTLNE